MDIINGLSDAFNAILGPIISFIENNLIKPILDAIISPVRNAI